MAFPAQFLHCCFKKSDKSVSQLITVSTGAPFHRTKTPEPMAVEPMLKRRDNGREVSSFSHSAPVFLEGSALCFFTLSSM